MNTDALKVNLLKALEGEAVRHLRGDNAPHTTVVLRIGTATFPRCVADMFTKDRLTITSIDDFREVSVYEPGTWKECSVADDYGSLYGHISETPLKMAELNLPITSPKNSEAA